MRPPERLHLQRVAARLVWQPEPKKAPARGVASSRHFIPRLSRGRRRSQPVADSRTPHLTCENPPPKGAERYLGSTDNAEADGSIPSSPTKDLMCVQ